MTKRQERFTQAYQEAVLALLRAHLSADEYVQIVDEVTESFYDDGVWAVVNNLLGRED